MSTDTTYSLRFYNLIGDFNSASLWKKNIYAHDNCQCYLERVGNPRDVIYKPLEMSFISHTDSMASQLLLPALKRTTQVKRATANINR